MAKQTRVDYVMTYIDRVTAPHKAAMDKLVAQQAVADQKTATSSQKLAAVQQQARVTASTLAQAHYIKLLALAQMNVDRTIQLEKSKADALARIEQTYSAKSEFMANARLTSKAKLEEKLVAVAKRTTSLLEAEERKRAAELKRIDLQLSTDRAAIDTAYRAGEMSRAEKSLALSAAKSKASSSVSLLNAKSGGTVAQINAIAKAETAALKLALEERIRDEKYYEERREMILAKRAARTAEWAAKREAAAKAENDRLAKIESDKASKHQMYTELFIRADKKFNARHEAELKKQADTEKMYAGLFEQIEKKEDATLIAQMNAALASGKAIIAKTEQVDLNHTRWLDKNRRTREKNLKESNKRQEQEARRHAMDLAKAEKLAQAEAAKKQKTSFTGSNIKAIIGRGLVGGTLGGSIGGAAGGAIGATVGPMISGLSKLGPLGWAAAAGLAATAGAALAVSKAFSVAVTTGSEFEKAMSNLRAITQPTRDEFVKLEYYARQLGKTSVYTATESANAFTELAKLGYSTKEIIASGADILDLAAATGASMEESALVAARTIKQFGMSASDTKEVVDLMTYSFARSALDMKKFSESMSYAGPLAAGAGASLNETTAALAVMSDRGIDASKAGTALRMMFVRLSDSSSTVSKLLKKAAPEAKTFSEKMEALSKMRFNTSGVQKLFGQYASAGAAALLNANDAFKQFSADFQNNAKDFAKATAKMQMDNLKGDLKMLSSAWQEFGIALYESIGPGMRPVIQAGYDAIRRLGEWMVDNGEYIGAVAMQVGNGFKVLINAVELAVKPIKVITEALNDLKLAMATPEEQAKVGPSITDIEETNKFLERRKKLMEELERTRQRLGSEKIVMGLYKDTKEGEFSKTGALTSTTDTEVLQRQKTLTENSINMLTAKEAELQRASMSYEKVFQEQRMKFGLRYAAEYTEAVAAQEKAFADWAAETNLWQKNSLLGVANAAAKKVQELDALYMIFQPNAEPILPGPAKDVGDNEGPEKKKNGFGSKPFFNKTLYWYDLMLSTKKKFLQEWDALDDYGYKAERTKADKAINDRFNEAREATKARIKEIRDRIAVDEEMAAKGKQIRLQSAIDADRQDFAELTQWMAKTAEVHEAHLIRSNREYDKAFEKASRIQAVEAKRAELSTIAYSDQAQYQLAAMDRMDTAWAIAEEYEKKMVDIFAEAGAHPERFAQLMVDADAWAKAKMLEADKKYSDDSFEIARKSANARRAMIFETTSANLGAQSGNVPSAWAMVEAEKANKLADIQDKYNEQYKNNQEILNVGTEASAQEYAERMVELNDWKNAQILAADVEARNAKYELFQQEAEKYKKVFDTVRETQQIYHQMELDRIDARYEREMEHVSRLRDARLVSDRTAKVMEKQAERRKEAATKAAMERDKAWARAAIIMNTASAIIGTWSGYAKFGPWGTVAAGAQTAALTGLMIAQLAQVDAQKMATGGFPQGPNALVQMNERGQEAVLNAQATRRLGRRTINDLNNGRALSSTQSNTSVQQTFIYSPSHNFESSSEKVDIFKALEQDREKFAEFVGDSRKRGYKV